MVQNREWGEVVLSTAKATSQALKNESPDTHS